MAKRKLSIQQKNRIQAIQDKRRNRKISVDENTLGAKEEGLIIAHHGTNLTVEKSDGENIRCHYRQNLGSIVTGDKVIWQPQETTDFGIISAVLPRRSLLSRPVKLSPQNKDVAANIDQIIIVIAVEPEPVEHYIDRYLVAAEHQHIKPILLLNKIDLLSEEKHTHFETLIRRYESLGYQVISLSAFDLKNDSALQPLLDDKTSIFVGQSGVGKSEIIHSLLPDIKIRIGDISASNKRGRHTTTTATLYHLPHGGILIDSPGIREFGLWDLPQEAIFDGFIDFKQLKGQCKFRNCNHTDGTPGCAILEAVKNNQIDLQRFKNYHRILCELD